MHEDMAVIVPLTATAAGPRSWVDEKLGMARDEGSAAQILHNTVLHQQRDAGADSLVEHDLGRRTKGCGTKRYQMPSDAG